MDKSRVPCSSKFAWKKDRPVMVVSDVLKPGENAIHDVVVNDEKEKPISIDF